MKDESQSSGAVLKARWQGLEPRQRFVLAGAGFVIVALVLWLWVWEPLRDARERARAQVAEQQALAGWLQAVAPVAAGLREDGGAADELNDRSLLGMVDETARAAGLAAAIGRIEPAGENQVRIWLNDAGFATLMGWLEQVAAGGIQVRELTAEGSAQTGAVNARITLGRDA